MSVTRYNHSFCHVYDKNWRFACYLNISFLEFRWQYALSKNLIIVFSCSKKTKIQGYIKLVVNSNPIHFPDDVAWARFDFSSRHFLDASRFPQTNPEFLSYLWWKLKIYDWPLKIEYSFQSIYDYLHLIFSSYT